jgi:antirepressor protein
MPSDKSITSTTLQHLDFQGDPLSTCKNELTGMVYCLPREICERLGIAWQAQHEKLRKSTFFQRHMSRQPIVTPSGTQEMLLLDVEYLPAWLGSISTERVKPEIKDKLLAYQEECAKALRDYWVTGQARNPRVYVAPQISALERQEREVALFEHSAAFLKSLGQLTPRDELMFGDLIRNAVFPAHQLLAAGGGQGPTTYGFSVAERVMQLGYRLTRTQQARHFPKLGKRIASEWRTREHCEPKKEMRFVDGATREVAWYPDPAASWADVIIQTYLAQFPECQRSSHLPM